MIYLLTLVLSVHAGILKRICESFITDDPGDAYETVPNEYLDKAIERLEIKERWNTLSEIDRITLRQMLIEKGRRGIGS